MLKKLIALCLAFSAALAMAAVDVNKASHSDLQEVKGIGPATATRILDARKQAPFKNWDDFITRVKGIAAPSAAKLSDEGLTVNGQAYKQVGKPAAKPVSNNEKSSKPSQIAGKKQEKG